MQINRLFEIVYLLLSKKNTTAKELAEHFEVSQRTIYRDIETLCQAGIPIYTNKGKGGGICLLDQFVLNKSVLNKQEQQEILSALQGINATSYSEAGQVLSKLSSLFGTKNPDWIEVDFSNWSSNEEDKQKFTLLKDAVLNQKVIQYDYYNSYGEESSRMAEPVKLIFRGQSWYLYGYCREKKDFRYFKITRMKNLIVSEETFELQPDVLHRPETGQPNLPPMEMISITLKVDAEMAYRIFDEFPKENITRNEDSSYLVRTRMQYGGWLFGYLMSYEDHYEILEPETLREEMRERYKNICRRFKI